MSDKFVFVGLGEILWDLLPAGKQLGGAIANFAFHATAQGESGIIVSSLGDDELGHEIRSLLNDMNLSDIYIAQDSTYPTGTVSIELKDNGIPDYIIHKKVAWDYIPDSAELNDLAKTADVVCFGTLAQRSTMSRKTIQSFLKYTGDDCLKIYDINLRQNFYNKTIIKSSLQLANVLKINDEELPVIADMLGLSGTTEDQLKAILNKFKLELIVLTQGGSGSILITDKEISRHPGYHIKIVDTVGAGDSFTASVAVAYKNGLTLDEINEQANKIASFVCGSHGGMPEYPKDLVPH